MQLHNILITDNTGFSSSLPSETNSVLDLDGSELIVGLTNFLSSSNLLGGSSISLVLDQSFIRYQYFNFPLVSTRRIQQVLQFELDDTLLKDLENYQYAYVSKANKKTGIIETGVFIIEKRLLDELISIFRQFNLDLRWVTSLEHLMDLAYQDGACPLETGIHVVIDGKPNSARLFTYHSGFLTGVSALPAQQEKENSSPDSASTLFTKQLNQKISAIQLAEPELSELTISNSGNSGIIPIDQQLVFSVERQHTEEPAETRLRFDHPGRINLIKSHILIIQELKKYARPMMIVAGILFCSLALYIGSVTYRGYHDHITITMLNQQMEEAITRYLPAGTSKTNALYILKERIQGYQLAQVKKREFEQRRYQVARTLTDLSLLKEEIPSLTLNRFTLNEQVIRFQGQIESITEFDRMQESLIKLFPSDRFRINTSEKSRGTGAVEFSTTIQKQKR